MSCEARCGEGRAGQGARRRHIGEYGDDERRGLAVLIAPALRVACARARLIRGEAAQATRPQVILLQALSFPCTHGGDKIAHGDFEIREGQIFAGYRVVQKLGPGVMGVVYLAEARATGKKVALKILQAELASDGDYVEQFEEQASAAISIKHRNVAAFYAAGREQERLYTACEFIPGETFAALIKRQGRVDPQIALSLLTTIAKALSYLHSLGITHGGVNPGNIRMTPMGEIKLVDVGLAKKLALRPGDSKGQAGVTPVYLAPELVSGPQRAGLRSDIYSLGITAYEALTGNKPFAGETPHETVLRILNQPLEAHDLKGVPPRLAELIVKMTSKAPQERPASMLEVISEMEQIAEEIVLMLPGTRGIPGAARFTTRIIRGLRAKFVYVLIAAVLIGTFVVFSLPGRAPSTESTRRRLTSEERAERALREAIAYEAQKPDKLPEVRQRYSRITSTFPDTSAAALAIAAERRVALALAAREAEALLAQGRIFEAGQAYDNFEKHYASTVEGSDAARKEQELRRLGEDRFNRDLLEAEHLFAQGKLEKVVKLLKSVEVYGNPAQREKAVLRADKMLGSGSTLALQDAGEAAWRASGPMLALTARQITGRNYAAAAATCESFLTNPLPQGIDKIIRWEKEDISKLRQLHDKFEAALDALAEKGEETNLTLVDGQVISGRIKKEMHGYDLELGQEGSWRIRVDNLATEYVLELAGIQAEEPDMCLRAFLYELHYGSADKARALLKHSGALVEAQTLSRYLNKMHLVSTWARKRVPASERDVRRAARIVESTRALIKSKKWSQAYPLLKQAVELNPAEKEAYPLLAQAAAGKGLPAKAIDCYQAALEMAPLNLEAWNELGKLHFAREELGLSLAAFGQAARIDPADPVAMQGRVETLLALGREEEARRVRAEWEKTQSK